MKRRLDTGPIQVTLVGVLTREVATRLIEISRSGCLLESGQRIDEGTVAVLRLVVQGQTYVEDVRATRCVTVAGSGSSYLIGAEFLHTSNADGMSIRRALAGSLGSPGEASTPASGSLSL
jgi:hypothetical protein